MRATLNISLPERLKEWVEAQVAEGGYATASEYIRQLLRTEQRRETRRQIEDNLHEALDSGPSTPMTPADWHSIRREGRKRIAAKKRAKQ